MAQAHSPWGRPGTWAAILLVASFGIGACNMIDVVRGRDAKLTKMVPGGDLATGDLDCWVTIEFERYPDAVDLADVRVRFESIALTEPVEYDWSFIASHDVVAAGEQFGSGYHEASHTQPGEKPPLKHATKVRLPLRAKPHIDHPPATLWLEAELYWGGRKQDSMRRALEHVYESRPGRFL